MEATSSVISNKSRKTAAGPPGHFIWGHAWELKNRPLDLFANAAAHYGDVVRFYLGRMPLFLIVNPDYVQEILQNRYKHYNKQTHGVKKLQVFGEGLLLSEGDVWRRHRSRIQPVFHKTQLSRYFDIMAVQSGRITRHWLDSHTSGHTVALTEDITKLTLTIVCQCLFGRHVPELSQIESSVRFLMHEARRRLYRLLPWPDYLPTPGNLRFKKHRRRLSKYLGRLITQPDHEEAGLLAILTGMRQPDGSPYFTPDEIEDETQTFFLAGHDTTATTVIWCMYLLSRHPAVRREVQNEIDCQWGQQSLSPQVLERMVYLKAVVNETLRLYPPAWIIPRSPLKDDTLGDHTIPAKSSVYISPYILHRHRDFWDHPSAFQPGRFLNGNGPAHPFAYIPFGSGPRMCIGKDFALLEAMCILAHIYRFCDVDVTNADVKPKAGITLHTHKPLRAHIRQRDDVDQRVIDTTLIDTTRPNA